MSDTNVQRAPGPGLPGGMGLFIIAATIAVVALAAIFHSGLGYMVAEWSQEEYSHGYLIPVIAGFMVYQHRQALLEIEWRGSWSGVALVAAGLVVMVMGELSALYIIVQYSFLMTLTGLLLALTGWSAMRYLWVPLVYLVFMIPLPDFLYQGLSAQLQLISSQLGVAVIRWFNISVYLQGNVIDLGNYQLQVVEACSGLRYLFPLMSFGFLCAYLFRAPLWQKAVIFLSSIPLTVFMNSFRIGVIGVLVDNWGIEQAEGFLHDFEGWVIFMTCVGLLFLEMWILTRFRKDKPPLRDVFNLDFGEPARDGALTDRLGGLSRSFLAGVVLVVLGAIGSTFLSVRAEAIPERAQFVNFSRQFDGWKGVDAKVEQSALTTLRLEDYLSLNYLRGEGGGDEFVNVWVAYYESQRKGSSVHSPRSCIPGVGWQITNLTQRAIDGVEYAGQSLMVNRVVISKGNFTQLVYYWFDMRGRNMTNEYLLKWYLFWDSLTRNRTDGALVRVTTFVPEAGDIGEADERLTEFVKTFNPQLPEYIPR